MSAHCKQTGPATLLAAALLAGCGQQDAPQEEMAPGQEPYLRYCASCHGNRGEGRSPSFPPLNGSEWLELSPGALSGIVLFGLRGEIEVNGARYNGYMPPLKHLRDHDVAAIVTFMKSAWTGEDIPFDADDVAEVRSALAGRKPFEGRAGVDEALEQLP